MKSFPNDLLRTFILNTNAKVTYTLIEANKAISVACLIPHFRRQLHESQTRYKISGKVVPVFSEVMPHIRKHKGYWPDNSLIYKQEWITSGPRSTTILSFRRIIDYVKRISLSEQFYENGSLYKRNTTRDSIFEGIYLSWHPVEDPHVKSPLLKYRINYSNGYREGIEEEFYSNGSLKETTNWVCGFYEGPKITYTINGEVIDKIVYEHGVPQLAVSS